LKKILIIRFSSIGDIILTTPVIRCLKKQLPNVEIHFLTKPQYKELLSNNPYIDCLHLLDKPILQKANELKKMHFDCIIDLHNNLRSLLFKSIINTESYSFNKLNFEKWLMVNFKINTLPKKHIVERYLETTKTLGVTNDGEGLDYFLPKNISIETYNYTSLQNEKYIAFAIGANHFTKKLPNEKIIEICNQINHKIILLGGKEDEANGEIISNICAKNIINFCGKLSINESAFIIKNSLKVITHDTGMMHIAAAFKKEIISIWGNTIPEFGMTPYYGKLDVGCLKLEVQNLSCRPCSKIGFSKCPKGHFNCMKLQNIENIISTTNS